MQSMLGESGDSNKTLSEVSETSVSRIQGPPKPRDRRLRTMGSDAYLFLTMAQLYSFEVIPSTHVFAESSWPNK